MRKHRIAAILIFGLLALPCTRAAASDAQEPWQKEFEEVCSQTQDAMTFSPRQLESLVHRCDALVPQIEKLDDVRKRVYLPRLRQCRGVFTYVLESKTETGSK